MIYFRNFKAKRQFGFLWFGEFSGDPKVFHFFDPQWTHETRIIASFQIIQYRSSILQTCGMKPCHKGNQKIHCKGPDYQVGSKSIVKIQKDSQVTVGEMEYMIEESNLFRYACNDPVNTRIWKKIPFRLS